MEIKSYSRVVTTVTFEISEQTWQLNNDEGRPFKVRQIMYFGGSVAQVEGWAVKKDGEPGSIQRRKTIDIIEIPPQVYLKMRQEFKAAVRRASMELMREFYDSEVTEGEGVGS